MKNAMRDSILELYFSKCTYKINKNENLKDYYQSFSKKELQTILGIYLLIKDDSSLLLEVPFHEQNTKKEIIEYLLNHYPTIYQTTLLTINDELLLQLKNLIHYKGYQKMSIKDGELNYSISFLDKLNQLKLAKLNYDNINKEIELFVPKELLELMKKLIHNKDFLKRRQKISEIGRATQEILSAYGILSLSKLTTILNDKYQKIAEETLEEILRMLSTFNNDLNIFEHDTDILIANCSFEEEDDAFPFYESLEDGEYKLFSKEEYEALYNRQYYQQFSEYRDLMRYLYSNLDLSESEMESFKDMILDDYLSSCQLDEEEAKKNLMINLEKIFPDLSLTVKIIIKKKLSNLAKVYPIFYLKGYSIAEKEK